MTQRTPRFRKLTPLRKSGPGLVPDEERGPGTVTGLQPGVRL